MSSRAQISKPSLNCEVNSASGNESEGMIIRRLLIGTMLLLLVVGAFSYGLLAGRFQLPPYRWLKSMADSRIGRQVVVYISNRSLSSRSEEKGPLGRWVAAPDPLGAAVSEELMAQLDALGYVSGVQEAPAFVGVTRYDPDQAQGDLNLYNSGHDQVAYLIDMEGNVVHTWSFDIAGYLDSALVEERDGTLARLEDKSWRRVHLLDDGQLLVIFDGLGLAKLDKDSDPIWVSDLPVHHDLAVDESSGRIYALTRERKIVPRFSSVKSVINDRIVELDGDGKVLRDVSLLEALENSIYARGLLSQPYTEDILHTNGIQLLSGMESELPAFKRGNVLISIRHLDMLAVVDLDREAVVWALSGLWRHQHNPKVLDTGNLLVFDNFAGDDTSRVVEVDPMTQEVIWAYEGTDETPFFSHTCGVAQRLGNGNTLITETDAGRAIEVTPDKDIVWEFYNPARAGENGQLIAALFEMERLPAGYDGSWLEPEGDEVGVAASQ